MEASCEHSDVLTRLRASGLRLAIDDFGVGYSSLDHLGKFPVDRIKIVQGFIVDIPTIPGNVAIVKAAISIAAGLGVEVIADGVETEAQIDAQGLGVSLRAGLLLRGAAVARGH